MEDWDRVVAVALLTERDLSLLGQGFRRAYRLPEDDPLGELIVQINSAEQRLSFIRQQIGQPPRRG